jgi:hypothetical protein
MTLIFTTDELTGLRDAQSEHMMDTYVPQAYSRTFNAVGEPVVTYTDGTAAGCGLDMRPGSERHGPGNTLLEYDATVRLPVTATPNARDRVKITKRFDETLATALVYEIVGPIQRGPSGIRLLLKRVEV